MNNYFSDGILWQLVEIWNDFSATYSTIYDFFSMPLKDLLSFNIPVVDDILKFIVNVLGIGDWSLITIVFGSGLILFFAIVLVKFLLAIIPDPTDG